MAAGLRQAQAELRRQRGHFCGFGQTQHLLKGQRLQRVARQQRAGLAVAHVHGGLDPAQHVVVHAGQVVVHQRVGVDQLDCAGAAANGFMGRRAQGRTGDRFGRGPHQQWAQAFAAVEHGVAHRRTQLSRGLLRQRRLQRRFHLGQTHGAPGGQRVRGRRGCGHCRRRLGSPAHGAAVQGRSLPFSSTVSCCSNASRRARQ